MHPSPSAPPAVPPGFAADGLNSEFSISAILVWTSVSPAKRAAVITISSRHNPFVQQCRDLARKRDAGSGDVLLDGLHLLSDALAAGVPIAAAAAPDAFWQSPVGAPLADALESGGAILYGASPAVLEAASPVKAPTGIVAIARWWPADVHQGPGDAAGPRRLRGARAGPGEHRRHYPLGGSRGGDRRHHHERVGGPFGWRPSGARWGVRSGCRSPRAPPWRRPAGKPGKGASR